MPKSIEIAKPSEAAPKAAKAKRIALPGATLPGARSGTISLPGKKKAATDNSPLEWYRLTEITMHVLNAVIIKTTKEQMAERRKANPDRDKIMRLESKILEVITITREPKNFDSTTRMRQLLEEYDK